MSLDRSSILLAHILARTKFFTIILNMDHLSNCNIFACSLMPDSPDTFHELIEALYCGTLTATLKLLYIQDVMVRFSIPVGKTLEVLYLYHIVNNRLRMFNLKSEDYRAIYDFLAALDYQNVEIDDSLIINFIASLAKLRLLRRMSDEISLSFPTTAPYHSKLEELAKSWMVFYNGTIVDSHTNQIQVSRSNNDANDANLVTVAVPTILDDHSHYAPIEDISSNKLSQSPCTPRRFDRYSFQPYPSYAHQGMELARRLANERVQKLQDELNLFQQDETDLVCIPHLQDFIMIIPRQSVGICGSFMSLLTFFSSAVVNRCRGYRTIPINDNAELVEISP
ncbi:hypothetical protein V1515DRAFT_588791 [Lipomyces mesembrius]